MYNFWTTKSFLFLCSLQTEENDELKRAHDKRRERLRLIQKNYKTVRDQLKEMEKSSGLWVHGNKLWPHNTVEQLWQINYYALTQCTGMD